MVALLSFFACTVHGYATLSRTILHIILEFVETTRQTECLRTYTLTAYTCTYLTREQHVLVTTQHLINIYFTCKRDWHVKYIQVNSLRETSKTTQQKGKAYPIAVILKEAFGCLFCIWLPRVRFKSTTPLSTKLLRQLIWLGQITHKAKLAKRELKLITNV